MWFCVRARSHANTYVRMSSELTELSYSELEQQGLLGACMDAIYAARHDTRHNRQGLLGCQRHHWRCMHEKRRPKTRAWAGELRRRARREEHVRARRQVGLSPSGVAFVEFNETHPQLVHTRPRAGVRYYVRARRQVGLSPSGWRGVVEFPPAWRPRAGVVLRCRCHSACTVVCRF